MSILTAAVYVLLVCGAAALVYWAVDKLGTPAPLNNVAKVLTVVVGILLIVFILLQLLGLGGPAVPPLT